MLFFHSTTYTKQKSMFSTSCFYIYDLRYWWIIVVIIVKATLFYNWLYFRVHYNVPEEGKPKEKFGICVKGLTFPDVDLSLRISMLFVYNMKKSAIVANQFIVVKEVGSNLDPKQHCCCRRWSLFLLLLCQLRDIYV